MLENIFNDTDWICLQSGEPFYYAKPQFKFFDIAVALSKTTRYGGHTKGFVHYSQAEHSAHMAQYFIKKDKFKLAWEALLHDGPEYVLQDIVTPFKRRLKEYHNIEKAMHRAMAVEFGIPIEVSRPVKEIDARILVDEARSICPDSTMPRSLGKLKPIGADIKGYSAEEAYKFFVSTAIECAPSKQLLKIFYSKDVPKLRSNISPKFEQNLHLEIVNLKKALDFYSSSDIYDDKDTEDVWMFDPRILRDRGKIARAALKKAKKSHALQT